MPRRDDAFKVEELGRVLPKAQKIIIIGALVTAILVFVYSFIFMTPFSDIYQMDGPFSFQAMAKLGITEDVVARYNFPIEAMYFNPLTGDKIGINLAYFTHFTRGDLQTFNHWLFRFGFFGLIATLIPLVYFSQKRKIYYKTNFVVIPAVAGFNLYIGIHMLVQLITNHVNVLSRGDQYELLNAYETHLSDGEATVIHDYYHTTDANPIFIIGYVIVFFVILFAVTSCLLTLAKYKHQKSQKPVDLSKVVIHE